MTGRPRITITPTTRPAAEEVDPIIAFALEHIGGAESIEIEVVYQGHEAAPDILTVNRAGDVVDARSDDA